MAVPVERVVTDYEDYTGRTAAIESVDIIARVTGYLEKIFFHEGTEVNTGTVLYEIDPRPYQAAYDQAKAQVAQNEASLKLAQSNVVRYEQAFKGKAVTAQDVETYRTQAAQAAATLQGSKASLETANLNLEWTKVRAPISGRLSETLVSIGNLVNADQTKLTTMVSLDPMYVYFNVDEATVERIQQLIREGKLKSALPEEFASPSNAPPQAADSSPSGTDPVSVAVRQLREHAGQMRQVYLGLGNEKGNPHVAYVDFFNNQIALSTATLQVRAIFWNPMPKIGPRLFTPGMFVGVRVPTSPTYKALLVSQGAVVTNQNLKFVDIVNDQDEVVQRPVKLGGIQDGLQVIASGLKPGDHVIVDGLQHVHTGSKVKPKLVPMPLPTPQEQTPTPSPPPSTPPSSAALPQGPANRPAPTSAPAGTPPAKK
ncbi:MAG TPA: efflux RND transporter periplasmic adaptor subunit [Planctomycetaceae bacterium]|nr:efflux RND transporter periplasmic adaptor subunit [Planctomycetaceae bacterium]